MIRVYDHINNSDIVNVLVRALRNAKPYNKNYKDVTELKQKLMTFKENLEHIDNHDDNIGFKVGVNMFSDMTEEEFVQ